MDKRSISSSSSTTDENQPRTEAPDIEKQPTHTSATPSTVVQQRFPETDLDRGVVGWDGQDDPNNPQNFSTGRKWGLIALISAFTFISPLASSMFSPAVRYIASDLKETNQTILSFTVSIYILGYAVSHGSSDCQHTLTSTIFV